MTVTLHAPADRQALQRHAGSIRSIRFCLRRWHSRCHERHSQVNLKISTKKVSARYSARAAAEDRAPQECDPSATAAAIRHPHETERERRTELPSGAAICCKMFRSR